ncbi:MULTISPECIES: Stp1/IreP family PP2C-type Ser/Thr phosphatase [Sporosarcina]|uniref:Stp1/IreP family PP2C-type Ser/Thr phosphatase n=1 Tax=Sporosarcina TaxID=1569 RepID=UPI0018911B9C|nr:MULTISPECIES: Stp1/IreP family PP2C-type Ser/Thr phosphatase [Sporosarcina]GKV64239.1 protein phosphatase PhpP [Sporosarcina sp. NCCP-2331]GLB54297.1 protein phosphatase PhpP [Sporosarcina sp. NCCP-2378]
MKYEIRSDTGLKRTVNEDEAAVFVHSRNNAVLAVIADGMGGHKGGDYASATAVQMIGEQFMSASGEVETEQDWYDLLYDSVVDVNLYLYNKAQQDESYKGMGTTLDLALVLGDQCLVFHVGDSRIYQVTGKAIRQITKDHSFVNVLLESGEITEQEAEVHPQRNWIMKAVGSEKSIVPDLYTIDLPSKSYLLLCTDGLSNKIEKELMLDIILRNVPLAEKADNFVELANNRGGEDNITVILLEIPENEVIPT